MHAKDADGIARSVDPEASGASDLELYCLLGRQDFLDMEFALKYGMRELLRRE